jgi:hypothetical protein
MDEMGRPRALYRVQGGWPQRWAAFGWCEMDEGARDRVMRQVYFGLEDLDDVAPSDLAQVRAVLWRQAFHAARSWKLSTPTPLSLDDVAQRLAPLLLAWSAAEAGLAVATRSAVLTPCTQLQFLSSGLVISVRLDARARSAQGLEVEIEAATRRLLDQIFPFLGEGTAQPVQLPADVAR